MRARMTRLTWKLLLYLVVAVLLGGLTRDRLLSGLLTAGFVFGEASVAVLLLPRTGQQERDEQGRPRGAGFRAPRV